MYCLSFYPRTAAEAAAVLGSHMGSLSQSEPMWARLFAALSDGGETAVREAAEALLRDAVPEEGDPHPQRGWVASAGVINPVEGWSAIECRAGIVLHTPGGVVVFVVANRDGTQWVELRFGRDSRSLALGVAITLRGMRGGDRCSDDSLIKAVVEGDESWDEEEPAPRPSKSARVSRRISVSASD